VDSSFDLAVIGGGIIGLSVAMEAVERFPSLNVVVLEKEARVASHQTGHNSGVIHSGVYYKPGSLKAKNCVAGAAAMVRFCKEYDIPHDICGKVIVATDKEDMPGLEELRRRGEANGVAGIEMIGPERLKEMEPHCEGVAALHVPSTGIVDYVEVANKYAERVLANGGRILTDSEVCNIGKTSDEIVFETRKATIAATWAVNCAGLHSDRIARLAGDDNGLRIIPFRGEYYELAPEKRALVKNLIYPVADPRFPFLGVHFTRKMRGGIEVGPNAVLALKREGYSKAALDIRDAMEVVSFLGFWRMASKYWSSGIAEYYRSLNKRAFTRALQKLVPEVRPSDLVGAGAGVRAQAVDRSGRLLDDFSIVQSKQIIHVCNVPSPAATASLLIGKQVVDMAEEAFCLGGRKSSNRTQARVEAL
jgi:L-2-hydroxyglutarate oxidase LhgO